MTLQTIAKFVVLTRQFDICQAVKQMYSNIVTSPDRENDDDIPMSSWSHDDVITRLLDVPIASRMFRIAAHLSIIS